MITIIFRECGRQPSGRRKRSDGWHPAIIRGVEAQRNSWPWMSSLRLKGSGTHFCGSAIIDRWWILTAAHCLLEPDSDILIPVAAVKVVVGDHVTTAHDPSEREYFPKQFLLHEDFNRTTMDNDIALIKLTQAIEYNEVIAPVCLPTSPPPVGEICTTTGWGLQLGIGNRLLATTHLKQLPSPIISNEVCRSQRYWGDRITPNMVCAGYRGHGACVGDSGGPIVCNNNGASPYSLVGVTSHVAELCRNPDGKSPSVFANVYNYLEWIQTTTFNCTGYIPGDNGHCYKFVNEEMTYAQAEEHCRAEGSYLVEIGSQIEQCFLQGLVGENNVWIGLQDKAHNENWSHWNSGAPVEYSNWRYDQPDNYEGEQYCGELVNVWMNGKWTDNNCNWRNKFVCERGSDQAFLATRKCYSFHEERKNYSEAQDMCASMGGHLVEINSEYEQLFLNGIFNTGDKSGCYLRWIWLGLNNHSDDGNRTTWHSGTNITYSNWGSGEESAHILWHRMQSTNCIVMDSHGKWQHSDCDTKLRFLCENITFTNSSRNVHTLCDFDVKEQITADVNHPFTIERSMYCNYFCSDDGQCYNYVKNRIENGMTYSEAEQFCHSEESYLVEVGSQMEQYFLQGLVGDDYFATWIGLQDKHHSGNWSHWNSGAPVEYSNWGDGQPDNYRGVQYCAELDNRRRNGKWNDDNCEAKNNFVCERGSNQASDMSGKCYSFHREEKNYADAREICTSEGGDLVEINSEWEQIFMYLWTNGFIWLGLNDLGEEGNWTKWNSGAPVTYSDWFSGEPDNGKGVNCGVIPNWGRWEVMMGGYINRFICEQSRNTTSFSRDDPVNNCYEGEPNCCSYDTCYTYHYEQTDCLEAQDICASEGGYLVEINTEKEEGLLEGWHFITGDMWIGLSDMDEQGNWKKWNSGAPVTYSNWDEGEPNIDKDQHTKEAEHCAEMMHTRYRGILYYIVYGNRRYRGEWNDLKCDTKRQFVCENISLTTSSKNIEVLCSDSG